MPEIFSVLPEELTLGVNLVINVFCILMIFRKIKIPIKKYLNLFFIFDALYYLFKILLNSNIDPQPRYRMQRLSSWLSVEDDLPKHGYLRAITIAEEAGYEISFRDHMRMLAPFFLVFLVDASNFFLMLTLIYFIRDRDKQARFLFGLLSITLGMFIAEILMDEYAINRTLFCLFISFFPIFSDNFTIKRCVVFMLFGFLNFPYGLIGFYSPELSAILFTLFIGAKLELIIEICSMIDEKNAPKPMPIIRDSQQRRRVSRGSQSHRKKNKK